MQNLTSKFRMFSAAKFRSNTTSSFHAACIQQWGQEHRQLCSLRTWAEGARPAVSERWGELAVVAHGGNTEQISIIDSCPNGTGTRRAELEAYWIEPTRTKGVAIGFPYNKYRRLYLMYYLMESLQTNSHNVTTPCCHICFVASTTTGGNSIAIECNCHIERSGASAANSRELRMRSDATLQANTVELHSMYFRSSHLTSAHQETQRTYRFAANFSRAFAGRAFPLSRILRHSQSTNNNTS